MSQPVWQFKANEEDKGYTLIVCHEAKTSKEVFENLTWAKAVMKVRGGFIAFTSKEEKQNNKHLFKKPRDKREINMAEIDHIDRETKQRERELGVKL